MSHPAAAETSIAEPVSATLPVPPGDAIDLSAPPRAMPAPRAKSSASSPSSIGAALAAAPSGADAFLAHLVRCLQTRAGADTVLQFLCYSSRLSGSVLESLGRPAPGRSARRLLAVALKLPSAPPVSPAVAALALRLSARFRAVSGFLSETRTVNRLWGLLGFYLALRGLVRKSRAKTTADDDDEQASTNRVAEQLNTVTLYAQVVLMIFYQLSENLAFLGSKKAIGLRPETQGRLAILSARCWGTYVFIQLGKLLLERSRKTASGEAVKDQAWASNWNTSFFRALAWAPLTVQWSMPGGGPLPDLAVGLLALYPSTGQLVDLWRETA